jgi:hypothetical protein
MERHYYMENADEVTKKRKFDRNRAFSWNGMALFTDLRIASLVNGRART